jgi:hypothetical protein
MSSSLPWSRVDRRPLGDEDKFRVAARSTRSMSHPPAPTSRVLTGSRLPLRRKQRRDLVLQRDVVVQAECIVVVILDLVVDRGGCRGAARSGLPDEVERARWDAALGYRYRTGGRGSRRVQRGGFQSEQDAVEALERALERLRRTNGTGATLTLAELSDGFREQPAQLLDRLRLRVMLGEVHINEPGSTATTGISPATDATTRSTS